MEKLLVALGLSSVQTVAISVSASNIIEMICVDKNLRMITNYACKELKYNNAIREIISYDDFSQAVQDLFIELNINPKNCNVILNIPNVHFAFTSLPLVLPTDQISMAISSEIEEMYLFKRHEPVISWNTVTENEETEKRYIVFGAVQENTIQNIKDIFEEIGAKLIAIETANSSMIKGIVYSGILDDEIENDETSNILLISSNSYSIFCMQGDKLVDYYDEPLAVKSFTSDEVYVAISSAAGSALENYPAKNLLIVSETNEVSAELLCRKINFEGKMKFLDRNMYSDQPFMETSNDVLAKYVPSITLEAVGAAVYSYEQFPVKFNFIASGDSDTGEMLTISLMGHDYELPKKSILNLSAVVAVAIFCLLFIISILISLYEKKLVTETSAMSDEFVTESAKLKPTSESEDNVNEIYNVTKEVSDFNLKEMALLEGIGSEIPEDVYLTFVSCDSEGAVTIRGKSTSSESIYAYVKGLKTKFPDITIKELKLAMGEETSGGTIYSFVIMSPEAERKLMEALNPTPEGENGEQGDKPKEERKALFPIGGTSSEPEPAPAPIAPPENAPAPANAPDGLPAPVAP